MLTNVALCGFFLSGIVSPPPGSAVDIASYLVPSNDHTLDIDPLDVNTLANEASGWTMLESGVAFIVDRAGEGNVERGITDTVDHYVPGPFVEVSDVETDGHTGTTRSGAPKFHVNLTSFTLCRDEM